jgi:ABC-2 type transport system permease protein
MGTLFFPGMLFFGVILVAQTLSSDVWKEKAGGTLRRTLTTSSRPWAFVAGRLAAIAFVMLAVGVLAMVVARILLQIDLSFPALALGWIVLAGVVFYVWFWVVNLLASGERGASVLTSIVVFFLALVGGGMFPLDVMPEWLARIGRWLPNGWASSEFSNLIQNKADWSQFRNGALMLVSLGAVGFGIVVMRLRKFVLR